MSSLSDSFGRRFTYLRLSVTDACNFRCVYCLPDGFKRSEGPPPLSVDEIRRAVVAFARLGFTKFRVTGGEPTVRPDIVDILRAVKSVPGVRRLVVSTNGYRLRSLARGFRDAGVGGVNVSVDSLRPATFAELTGRDCLAAVLDGVEAALAAGIPSVKLNTVLRQGLTEAEVDELAEYAATRPVDVRFIELMPTGGNRPLFQAEHLTSHALQRKLVAAGWRRLPREADAGPSVDFAHPASRGRLGIIAPYAPGFCGDCNRLRLTSRGALALCLFGDATHALRGLLAADEQQEALTVAIRRALVMKTEGHRLHEGISGGNRSFAGLGG